jgi:Fic family protein
MKTPCIPDDLPIDTLDWERLNQPVEEASSALSRYDGLLHSMINPDILLAPLTTREAVLSSRIEGTQASLSEVLQHEAGAEYDEVKTQDIYEILNYRKALRAAEQELEHRPISLSFIKGLHKIRLTQV